MADEVALSSETLAALTERSGGNPLFVRELVIAARAGDRLETLPESVESLLTTRIDTLDPENRMLLRYAAVVGPTFELDFLGEILEDEIPDAGDPARWEWLREFVGYAGDMTYAFRHDLSARPRTRGSRSGGGATSTAASRALERRGDEATTALLSLHFFEAGDHDKAWRVRGRRGRARAGDLRERRRRRAVRAGDRGRREPCRRSSARSVRACYEALGDVCERFGAYDRAFDALERRASSSARRRRSSTRGCSASRAWCYELVGALRGGARGVRRGPRAARSRRRTDRA